MIATRICLAAVSVGLLCVVPIAAQATGGSTGLDDDVAAVIYGKDYDNDAELGDSDYVAVGGIDAEVAAVTDLESVEPQTAPTRVATSASGATERSDAGALGTLTLAQLLGVQEFAASGGGGALLFLGTGEVADWYGQNRNGISNWTRRQLGIDGIIGLVPETGTAAEPVASDPYVISAPSAPDYVLAAADLDRDPAWTTSSSPEPVTATGAGVKGPSKDRCLDLCLSLAGKLPPNDTYDRAKIRSAILKFGGPARAAQCADTYNKVSKSGPGWVSDYTPLIVRPVDLGWHPVDRPSSISLSRADLRRCEGAVLGDYHY